MLNSFQVLFQEVPNLFLQMFPLMSKHGSQGTFTLSLPEFEFSNKELIIELGIMTANFMAHSSVSGTALGVICRFFSFNSFTFPFS